MTKQAAKQEQQEKSTANLPGKKSPQDMAEIMRAIQPAVQAKPDRFLARQGAFNTWLYWAESGSTVEQHLAPVFWLALASKFQPNDELIVKEDLGAWRAHFLIRSVGPDGVDIVELNRNEIGGVAAKGAKRPFKDGPRVEYRGQHLLWSVFDGSRELISQLPTEELAQTWLANSNVAGPEA